MMLLRAAVLATGRSGVRAVCCERLCELLNAGVHPVIPAQGSVGASGDLAPLAHLALGMIGEGEAEYRGETHAGAPRRSRRAGLAPLVLEAKEGLTLINGTQHMTVARRRSRCSTPSACARRRPRRRDDARGAQGHRARVRRARRSPRARTRARSRSRANLRALLAGSEIAESHKDCGKVQDPYSLRCMPQVHGATRDALAFARTRARARGDSVDRQPAASSSTTRRR